MYTCNTRWSRGSLITTVNSTTPIHCSISKHLNTIHLTNADCDNITL